MLALSAPILIAFSALVLFAMLVVARYTLDLVRKTKELSVTVERANARLRAAAENVAEELAGAEEQLAVIQEKGSDLRRKKGKRPTR